METFHANWTVSIHTVPELTNVPEVSTTLNDSNVTADAVLGPVPHFITAAYLIFIGKFFFSHPQ